MDGWRCLPYPAGQMKKELVMRGLLAGLLAMGLVAGLAGCSDDAEEAAPPPVASDDLNGFVGQYMVCEQLLHEQTHDPVLLAQLAKNIQMYCIGIDRKLADMRTRYAQSPEAMAVLERLKGGLDEEAQKRLPKFVKP